jgi:hypothetical protein
MMFEEEHDEDPPEYWNPAPDHEFERTLAATELYENRDDDPDD